MSRDEHQMQKRSRVGCALETSLSRVVRDEVFRILM